jgi:hypothetical protein
MSWLADRIEHWPIDKLLPYVRNARQHSDEQIAQIAASIAEFGFVNPILTGADGVLVAGHGRLAAARKLGLATVPVVVLDHLTPTQRRALVLADNRLAELATWDDALLRIELEALQDDGFDLDLTGFDADALAELLADEEPQIEGRTEDDAIPEMPEEPVSRSGDVWRLGPHRLVCGDATTAEAYARLFPDGERADMVFTDPPYNVNYANSAKDKLRGKHRPILNDALGEGFYDFLFDALALIMAHPRGAIYVAMSSSELDTLQSPSAPPAGTGRPSSSGPRTPSRWAARTTSASTSRSSTAGPKARRAPLVRRPRPGDVWQIKKPQKNDLHPTMKPVDLVERAIRNSSRPGDVVLDPFGGSGTTLIAAERPGACAADRARPEVMRT